MPVFEAQFVLTIASKTGWSEDHIRWQLPLWRAWSYYHGARILEGDRFRWPAGKSKLRDAIGRAKELARRMMGR